MAEVRGTPRWIGGASLDSATSSCTITWALTFTPWSLPNGRGHRRPRTNALRSRRITHVREGAHQEQVNEVRVPQLLPKHVQGHVVRWTVWPAGHENGACGLPSLQN